VAIVARRGNTIDLEALLAMAIHTVLANRAASRKSAASGQGITAREISRPVDEWAASLCGGGFAALEQTDRHACLATWAIVVRAAAPPMTNRALGAPIGVLGRLLLRERTEDRGAVRSHTVVGAAADRGVGQSCSTHSVGPAEAGYAIFVARISTVTLIITRLKMTVRGHFNHCFPIRAESS